MLFIITFIGMMAAIYSIPYIGHELKEKELKVDRARVLLHPVPHLHVHDADGGGQQQPGHHVDRHRGDHARLRIPGRFHGERHRRRGGLEVPHHLLRGHHPGTVRHDPGLRLVDPGAGRIVRRAQLVHPDDARRRPGPHAPQDILHPDHGRLRHQGGSGADAHLASRRPFPGPDPGQRAAVRACS